ncbi:MAG: hypothetical protein AAGD05_04130 [Bacteroidota bacterium]
MSYINAILNLLFGLFLMGLAYTGLSNYFGGNQSEVDQYEKLLNEGVTTIGILDSVYTEIEVKGISTYTMDYHFKVNGQDYQGDFSFDSPESITNPIIEVKYLAENPEINGVHIEAELSKAKEALSSSFDLWLGLGAALFGFFVIRSAIRKFRPENLRA